MITFYYSNFSCRETGGSHGTHVFRPGPVVVKPSSRKPSTCFGLAAGSPLSPRRLRRVNLVVWPVRGRVTSFAAHAAVASEKRCGSSYRPPNPPSSYPQTEEVNGDGADGSAFRLPLCARGALDALSVRGETCRLVAPRAFLDAPL